jgi:hypothetical protein
VDITTLPPEIENRPFVTKVDIMQRAVERYQREQRRNMARLAESRRRVFVVPRRTLSVARFEPEHLRRLNEATEAYERGDEAALKELVREVLGVNDPMVVSRSLRFAAEVREIYGEGASLPAASVYQVFLPYHRKRLANKRYAARADEVYERARRAISTTNKQGEPNRLASTVEHHRTHGQPSEEATRELLLGWLYEGTATGVPEDRLGPNAANMVSRKGTGRDDQNVPGLLAPLDDVTVLPGAEDEDFELLAAVAALTDADTRAGLAEQMRLAVSPDLQGYSGEEIAAKLGISHAYARQLLSRAHKRLEKGYPGAF